MKGVFGAATSPLHGRVTAGLEGGSGAPLGCPQGWQGSCTAPCPGSGGPGPGSSSVHGRVHGVSRQSPSSPSARSSRSSGCALGWAGLGSVRPRARPQGCSQPGHGKEEARPVRAHPLPQGGRVPRARCPCTPSWGSHCPASAQGACRELQPQPCAGTAPPLLCCRLTAATGTERDSAECLMASWPSTCSWSRERATAAAASPHPCG